MTSELVGQLLQDRRGHRVVPGPGALVAELGEVGEGRLAGRDREAREAVALEAEVDRQARRELDRVRDPLAHAAAATDRPACSSPGRHRDQLVARLEV